MKHFQRHEFQGWFDRLSSELKFSLDAFRDVRGKPVLVSPAPGAVGREMSPHINSMHNVSRWGEIQAIDVFPLGMTRAEDRLSDVVHALRAGFTGIGVYPGWRDGRGNLGGLHLDVRHAVQDSHGYMPGRDFHAVPALWSGFPSPQGQTYGPIDDAMPDGIGRAQIMALSRAQ